jgi:acyl-CoA synthetase (AMP-forming)/AMP-acid ligase II
VAQKLQPRHAPRHPHPQTAAPRLFRERGGLAAPPHGRHLLRLRLTYRELNEQANQMSHVFHGLGVRPGDRVMIILPNMPQMVVAFYGVLKAGGVVVLPNAEADAKTIIQQVVETQPKVLVTVRRFQPVGASHQGKKRG